MARGTATRSEGKEGAEQNGRGHSLWVTQPLQDCPSYGTRAGCFPFWGLILLEHPSGQQNLCLPARPGAGQRECSLQREVSLRSLSLSIPTLGPAHCGGARRPRGGRGLSPPLPEPHLKERT